MFERFTQPAREAVVHAQVEARSLRHGYIGTEHLLLGLLHEESGAGARTLARIGMDLETARADVLRVVGEGPYEGHERDAEALRAIGIDVAEVRRRWGTWRRGRCDPVAGHIPFTPRAKKVLQLSSREAVGLGHPYIGTEHILLGLLREGEGIAATLIEKRSGHGDVRKLVMEEVARGKDPTSRSA